MSRKSFDDGHQNPAHNSEFTLDFDQINQLFHGGREGAENVVRGLIDESQIAETGRTQEDVDDLGDLVDPQNDTYEEEGTHGLGFPLAIKAGIGVYKKARKSKTLGPAIKSGEKAVVEKGKEVLSEGVETVKGKVKEAVDKRRPSDDEDTSDSSGDSAFDDDWNDGEDW